MMDWDDEPTDDELPYSMRQNVIDGLSVEKIRWSGEMDEVTFLSRLYDLKNLPSGDHRFRDAAGDIWQHRVNNPMDWNDDWVYADHRFNVLRGPAAQFLAFLCEMVHPLVRPDRNEALKLVAQFNDQLRRAGWELIERELIAGRPRYVPQRVGSRSERSVDRARAVADALDAGWMKKEIERVERAVQNDPALAVGTAKELVETCCKTILGKLNVQYSPKADLPELTKLVCKQLQLVPDDISDKARGAETIRLLLRNLTTITQYVAELRGLYGSGHGRDGKHRGLEPRHARLAVAAAAAFIDFVTETYEKRSTS